LPHESGFLFLFNSHTLL